MNEIKPILGDPFNMAYNPHKSRKRLEKRSASGVEETAETRQGYKRKSSIIRENGRTKVIKTANAGIDSKTLQIVTVRESQGRGVTREKLLECAEKLQKKYLSAQRSMCSSCKGQPLTTVYTSFKVDGQEKEVEMRALIVDLESLAQAGIPGMEKYLNLN